jgi:hypothetical protein
MFDQTRTEITRQGALTIVRDLDFVPPKPKPAQRDANVDAFMIKMMGAGAFLVVGLFIALVHLVWKSSSMTWGQIGHDVMVLCLGSLLLGPIGLVLVLRHAQDIFEMRIDPIAQTVTFCGVTFDDRIRETVVSMADVKVRLSAGKIVSVIVGVAGVWPPYLMWNVATPGMSQVAAEALVRELETALGRRAPGAAGVLVQA